MNKWKAIVDTGATFSQSFFYYAGDDPVDLTGWTGYFRFFSSSGALLIELGAPGAYGSVAVDPLLGKLLLSVTTQGTGRLTGRTGAYELWATDGTTTLRLLDGPALYRQGGAGPLDSVNVIVSRTTSAVTVERATVNQIKIVDRGPPGRRGDTGATGPSGITDPVTYTANGAMISADKIALDAHEAAILYVRGLIRNATTSGDKLTNATVLNSYLATACARGNTALMLPGFEINIGTNLVTGAPTQGLRFMGAGSTSFVSSAFYPNKGTCIKYEGGGDAAWDKQVATTSASSVAIGTGSKSFTIVYPSDAIPFAPGQPVRFTATAGASGTMTGIILSIDSTGLVMGAMIDSVTGTGTGTAWDVTTLLDSAPITLRSHAGLVFENITVECTNPAFTGWILDINGDTLGSDTSQYQVNRCTFWCSGTPTDATYRPTGNASGGIFMASGWGRVDGCTFWGMLRGMYLSGQWQIVTSTNQFIAIQDCAVDTSCGGSEIVVNSEPALHIAGTSYAHGGIRAWHSYGSRFEWNVGDAAQSGPLITMYGCNGCHATGQFSIGGSASGAGKCAIKLDGCYSTLISGCHLFVEKLIDVASVATSVGITVLSTDLAPADLVVGTNYSRLNYTSCGGTNTFGVSGETRVSSLYGTNGARVDFGLVCGPGNYAGVFAACITVGGQRTAALAWGSNSGQAIEYMNTGHWTGSRNGMLFRTSQSDAAAGYGWSVRDAAATNGQALGMWLGPDGWQLISPGALVGPLVKVVSGGHLDFAATKLVNLADPTNAQDAATRAYVLSKVKVGAANQNLAFSATLATLTSETKTVTLTSAAVGDNVVCNARAALPDGVTMQAWISATNTGSVKMFNSTLAAVDLSSVALDFTVVHA